MIRNLIRLAVIAGCLVLLFATLPMVAKPCPLELSGLFQSSSVAYAEPQPITHTIYLPIVAADRTMAPFGYGVQADPRGNTSANIGHIKAMGLGWVKLMMAWKDVEITPGTYAWDGWDDVIEAYHANGIKVMLTIAYAPRWARPPDDDKGLEGLPAEPATYAAFVTQVANRYRGKVQAIEVWHDQNLWYAVGGQGRINVASYVQLLRAAYQALKAVDPGILVISGGLTAAGDVDGYAVDDIAYLNQMYASGARDHFDAVGSHPGGYNCPALADWRTFEDPTATFRAPVENRHHAWCFLGSMEGLRNVMIAHGDSHKGIAPTAFGWAVSDDTTPCYLYAVDNTYEEQAQWIVEAYQWGKAQGRVGPMFLWNLDYGVTAPGTELACFSLLTPAGPVPAYAAIAAMPK